MSSESLEHACRPQPGRDAPAGLLAEGVSLTSVSMPAGAGHVTPASPGAAGGVEGLLLADMPRLELERVVGELTARAQDELGVQRRLRALLRANAAVAENMSLPVILRNTVTAAKDLVPARYAALAVIRHGVLEQFVHAGMTCEQAQVIGEPPRGQGVLGLLTDNPQPVRLSDLGAHPAAVGVASGHPPMDSFLGVPIIVGEQVFGNLYLTDSVHGQFSAEDEQLLICLAASAGVAIAHAGMHEETAQVRHWLAVSTQMTQQLLADTNESPLEVVLRHAAHGARAEAAAFVLRVGDDEIRVAAAWGPHADWSVGDVLTMERTLAGRVINTGRPVLIDDYAAEFGDGTLTDARATLVSSGLGVPLLGADGTVLGALVFGRPPGLAAFTETDRDHLAGFASQAGLAVELDRSRNARDRLRTVEDHDRIAADLHDHVVQRLFATGIGLQGMIEGLARPDQRARVSGYVDGLDATIRQIRSTIFGLTTDIRAFPAGLQHRILAVLDDQAEALGFTAGIQFSGPLDIQVPAGIADDVVAVTREALSNTARHAHASSVEVQIALAGTALTVDVTDNGAGIGTGTRSSGIANMRRRAELHDGALEHTVPVGGGTHLHWSADITPAA